MIKTKKDRITATQLKRNTAEILNSLYFDQVTRVIVRYGNEVATLSPIIKKGSPEISKEDFIERFCGSWSKDMPNMSKVSKDFKILESKFEES